MSKEAWKARIRKGKIHCPDPAEPTAGVCKFYWTAKNPLIAQDNQKVNCLRCLMVLRNKPQYVNLLLSTRGIDARGI